MANETTPASDVSLRFGACLERCAPELVPDLDYEPGFHVLPSRWVVERTFGWLSRNRRMSKNYERLASTAEALIYLVGIQLLLVRLTRH